MGNIFAFDSYNDRDFLNNFTDKILDKQVNDNHPIKQGPFLDITDFKDLISSDKCRYYTLDEFIKTKLWPLRETIDDKLSPNIRAIQFNIFENLGTTSINKFRKNSYL